MRGLFWAMMMKLSPGRRVLFLIALVFLVSSGLSFRYNETEIQMQSLAFLGGVALLILLALELADRVMMKRDLEIAREIQSWLMPAAPPVVPGVDIAFRSRPANNAVTCLLPLGRIDEARREARTASELSQSGLSVYALALTDYCGRDYRAALAHAQTALGQHPDSEWLSGILIDSYLASGQFDEAWFFAEKNGFDLDGYRALIRGLKGDKDQALRLARERAAAHAQPMPVARLFAAGGDPASAVHWLEEAGRQHDLMARIFTRYCAEFDSVRPSPAFHALLQAMSKQRP
jgi:hypothetical protein